MTWTIPVPRKLRWLPCTFAILRKTTYTADWCTKPIIYSSFKKRYQSTVKSSFNKYFKFLIHSWVVGGQVVSESDLAIADLELLVTLADRHVLTLNVLSRHHQLSAPSLRDHIGLPRYVLQGARCPELSNGKYLYKSYSIPYSLHRTGNHSIQYHWKYLFAFVTHYKPLLVTTNTWAFSRIILILVYYSKCCNLIGYYNRYLSASEIAFRDNLNWITCMQTQQKHWRFWVSIELTISHIIVWTPSSWNWNAWELKHFLPFIILRRFGESQSFE